jgi:hypothetical protein
LSKQEKAFLISKDKLPLFGRSDFYIQKVSLPKNLEKTADKIYLIENIIAEFCNSFSKIDEKDWWLCATHYNSLFLRIIAGIGKGIALSRFLSSDSNVSDEISKTMVYLQRWGMKENIKIFSSLKEIEIHPRISREINYKKILIPEYDETIASRLSCGVKPIISNGVDLKKFLNTKILYAAPLTAILILWKIDHSIQDNEKIISSLRQNVCIANKYMKIVVNSENFSDVEQLLNSLRNLRNPLELFRKTAQICRKYNFPVEGLSFEDRNVIKVKTSLNRTIFDQLKSRSDVEIEKNSADEYEELGSNKKLGVVLCVK